MIVLIHDASTDKRTIQTLQWKPCPFCDGHQIHICSTGSYVAIACRETKTCGFEIYRSGTVESVNERWNRRVRTE